MNKLSEERKRTMGIRACFVLSIIVAISGGVPRNAAAAIVSYEVQFYQPGVAATGAPFTTLTIPAATVQCNQSTIPLPAAPVINPKRIEWDDPANPGKSCVVDQTAGLMALPIVAGNYTATITVTDDALGTSDRSAASNPFGRQPPPAARTGVKVLP